MKRLLFFFTMTMFHNAYAAPIGNPQNAADLPQQIAEAYKNGEREITIAPGKYVLPGGQDGASLMLRDMKNVTIDATGVEFSMTDGKDAIGVANCENLILRGPTAHYDHPRFSQAKILAFGTDEKGPFYEVQIDAGYPFDANWKASYIFDGAARKIKFRTWDMGAKSVEKQNDKGRTRVYWKNAEVLPPKYNVAVGDYLVCRGDGSSLLHVEASKNCTFENLNFYWGGIFGIFETGPNAANRYLNIKISTGPAPPGGENAPLISQSADGLHSAAARIGPDIQNCTFENMCDDAFAIHGYFVDVLAVDGAKLTTKALWGGSGFQVGDVARLSSDKGYQDEAKVVAIEKQNENFILTLERALGVKVGYKAGNASASGAGYKLIGNTIRNNRARGILVKGDNGLIENNLIDGSTMSGISIGPEYYWNEAGYCRNVMVRGNTIRNTNYATNNFGRNGALLIHGDGTKGNKNITIQNNLFEKISGPSLIIEWADGVQITNNSFRDTHALSVGDDDMAHSLIWLAHSRDIVLSGNSVSNAGADLKTPLFTAEDVTNVNGTLTMTPATFTYSNPLPLTYDEHGNARSEVRDPAIIREGDTYYLTFTMWPFRPRDEKYLNEADAGSSPGIALYSSKDLKDWKFENWVVQSSALAENAPYKHQFWAPEIHKIGGKFYVIFTASNWLKTEYNHGNRWAMDIFIGVADKVTGPYKNFTYVDDARIDTTLFEDDDGQTYAFLPGRDIYAQKIDLSAIEKGEVKFVGERELVVKADNADIGLDASPEYLEGPWTEKIGAKYYLFYAALYKDKNHPELDGYRTGVAYADNPLGPYTKDPRGAVFYGGHLAVFDGPDGRKWFSYRIENSDKNRGLLAVDPFDIDANGKVQSSGPSPAKK